ncbi:hydroxymethylglutaryl-CoA reductase (NADPH) [soil metagenome]
MDIRNCTDHSARRRLIEENLNVSLQTIGDVLKDDPSTIHCENLVGAISIPLGIAGPITIRAEDAEKEVYIPLATTEGALVASVNRGCKALAMSGGAIVQTQTVGTTRGPVFQTNGIREGKKLSDWIDKNKELLQKEATKTSSHLQLLKAETQINGTEVYVRFYYDTADAMGMNMVTIATNTVVQLIEKETSARCIAVAGNYDVDKKPSWMNSILGRGRRGWAEVALTAENVQNVLKTTPEKILEVVRSKCWGGSIMSGSLGFNAHFANIVAAFFAATGQDLAHVVEGSQGVTSARVLENGDLYFSISMPAMMLGTVGGGTKLQTQAEARSLTKAATSSELAEVLLGAVLAGELSLISSIAEHSLAKAHASLGR